jgi:uncharacterized membrane protein YeaQ/YmgE (transglycosylase-associated protein family)
MSIIGFLILGALAGWIAGMLVQGHGFGILGDIVVGIVGAFIGGFVGGALFHWDVTGLNISSLILSIIGAVILLLIVKALTPRRTPV